ncbi:hypothetical protein STCU_06474 [Strigomonas culicis]|uniref:Uncharacterized protein n=1 Tax=Strigomonas culicis TaxID=28005 RepID=S9TX01_9TRYP|nr:hypothetical protein STCU_07936 [Strigomonas culicis]EPY25793.1 hypothetical protein STCU_06474 [Strigomonas culicis]|eukprot:EPY23022.1 hypothetical protein STCU_07936 [Strigomonas culicis]
MGADWDETIPYLDPRVVDKLRGVAAKLVANEWYDIDDVRSASYRDEDYDLIAYTDASRSGWGAVVRNQCTGQLHMFQQRWILRQGAGRREGTPEALAQGPVSNETNQQQLNTVEARGEEEEASQGEDYIQEDDVYEEVYGSEKDEVNADQPGELVRRDLTNLPPAFRVRNVEGRVNARHSAHAEPRAAQKVIQLLRDDGQLRPGMRLALVTDHYAIPLAQKKLNGYGGIGKGYALNKLFERTYDLWYKEKIEITFFHIDGHSNPADAWSRNFGPREDESGAHDRAVVRKTETIQPGTPSAGFPPLSSTDCRLCEKRRMPSHTRTGEPVQQAED